MTQIRIPVNLEKEYEDVRSRALLFENSMSHDSKLQGRTDYSHPKDRKILANTQSTTSLMKTKHL